MLFFLIGPSKPANFKVIEAKDGEATLSWNEPLHKNGKIVKYNLIYRVLDGGRRIIKDIQKDEQFIVLSNLISNTRYSFTLSASTSAGTGETEEIEFDFSKSEFLKIGILVTEALTQRCSVKKMFLKMSQHSQENTCARVSF